MSKEEHQYYKCLFYPEMHCPIQARLAMDKVFRMDKDLMEKAINKVGLSTSERFDDKKNMKETIGEFAETLTNSFNSGNEFLAPFCQTCPHLRVKTLESYLSTPWKDFPDDEKAGYLLDVM